VTRVGRGCTSGIFRLASQLESIASRLGVSLAFRGFIGLQFLIILMIVLNDNNSIQNRYLNRSVFFIQVAPREYCAGSLSGATMGWGKFALARGALLKQTYKFAVVVGVLSIVGARTELARAAENGGSSAPSAQADAVNQALLKKNGGDGAANKIAGSAS